MIYFLYGPDTYRSRRKLGEIIAAFLAKARGFANVTRVDAADDPASLLGVGRTGSLFSQKELIVVERVSSASEEVRRHIATQLPAWAEVLNLSVVFWEGEMEPGGSALSSEIKKRAAKAQEFRPLGPMALSRWLEAELARRGMRLTQEEKRLLLERSGSDLFALANELDKIASGWSLKTEALTEEKIWNFTDAFFAARRRAFRPLERLLAAGEEPIYLLGALGSSLRSLALVWWGLANRKLPMASRGLHPFVVKKYAPLAKRLDASSLRAKAGELIKTDAEMKTGRPPSPLALLKLVLKSKSSG